MTNHANARNRPVLTRQEFLKLSPIRPGTQGFDEMLDTLLTPPRPSRWSFFWRKAKARSAALPLLSFGNVTGSRK